MENIFENNKFKITFLEEENIAEFWINSVEIEKEDVIEMHKQVTRLANGCRYAALFQAQDFFSITSEARVEGQDPVYSENLIAQGLIVKNLAQRLIGTFLIKFNKPVRETKLFGNYDDARLWLQSRVRSSYSKMESRELSF